MKLRGLLIAAVLLAAGATARADQPVPGRWFRLSSSFASAPCPVGKACMWRKTDHTLHYVDDTGSDIALGAGGGGSAGNWVFSGNNADLSAAGALGLGSSVATSIRFFPSALTLAANTVATGSSSATNTIGLSIAPNVADGASSVALDVNNQATLSTAGSALLRVRNNGTTKMTLDLNGVLTIPSGMNSVGAFIQSSNTTYSYTNNNSGNSFTGGLSLSANFPITGAASATNTTALQFTSALATGTTGAAFDFNNTVALTSAGDALARFRNNGATLMTVQPASAGVGGLFIGGDTTTPHVTLSNASGAFIGYGAVQLGVTSSAIAANGAPIVSDGTQTIGTNANPWPAGYAAQWVGAGATPSKAVGACLGGTQTVTLDANAADNAGTITMTSTATGTASATCATVSFARTWPRTPHCSGDATNAAAAALGTTAALFIDDASTTTALFVVKVGSTALVAGTYHVTYHCL